MKNLCFEQECAYVEECSDVCKEVRPLTELEDLKMEIQVLKLELEEMKKSKEFYYQQYNEYLEQAVKYRHAFKAVVEELKK
jgi:hypothetical protein